MNRTPIALGLAALVLSPALSCQQPITATGTVKIADMSNREARPPVAPTTESVKLEAGAAGMPTWAECTDAVWGTCTLRGKKVAVVVGKTKADAALPDAIGVDLNADGKLEKSEQMPLTVTEQAARGNARADAPKMYAGAPVECTFTIDGVTLPAKLGFMARGDSSNVSIQFASYLEATVKMDGAERTIAVIDKDQDGKYGSAGDLWTLRKGDEKGPTSPYGLSGISEKLFQTDHLVGIEVRDNVVKVMTTPAKGPDEKDSEAHRHRVEKIWVERFDKDRAEFYKARGLDESRPLASTPIHWNYVSFEQGLAMAKKANKPLFVDIMAFWCVWCYRMDYTTYPDKEVADLLNNSFVPVKIIQEQDLAGDYKTMMDKLEAKGIPAMGIFDAEGNKLHVIGGWKKPEDFAKELQTGLAAAKK